MVFPQLVAAQQVEDEEERANYQPYRDYGTDWRWGSLFGITAEDGILAGTGAIVYKFAFRTFPYLYRMQLVGGLTFKTGRFKVVYTAAFPDLGKHISLDILAYASELEVRNFYGYGNDTPRNSDLEKNNFYRVASRQYFLRPELQVKLGKIASVRFGASFKHFEVRRQENRFLSGATIPGLGDERSVLGAGLEFIVAMVDASVATREGYLLTISMWNFPGLFNGAQPFQRYSGDIRRYVSSGPATLALRVAAEKVDGEFPFYEAAFLGGAANLRGYNLNRFAGDASLTGSAELRLDLFRTKVLLPTQVGIFFFGDAGRVYWQGRSPKGWHADAGGGISLAPLSKELTFSVSVGSSVEGVFVNGGFGFSF
ncbi:MAG: BamA/TamA family outer membrane protein [Bacteroidetes bacterium]|nr:BamA/TamA family outer membrane protein [Bacteroidota bacterium]MCW5895246.1 BamA/TamA family outer membrane protein [Bacteroidota bacterium]